MYKDFSKLCIKKKNSYYIGPAWPVQVIGLTQIFQIVGPDRLVQFVGPA